MLSEEISSIAPNMPEDIRRWSLVRDYAKPSCREQHWDSLLAEWKYVPILIDYVENPANLLDKRFEAFLALLLFQDPDTDASHVEQRKALTHEIQRIVLENQPFARKAADEWLGLVEALVIKKMLGEDIPKDIPQWIHVQIERRK